MQKPNSPDPTLRSYSPFWPLAAVFLTLIFLQIFYVIEDLRGRSQIKESRANLRTAREQAETITRTAENVGRDLLALSSEKSHEADKIIAEFNIKLNSPPQPQPASTDPTTK